MLRHEESFKWSKVKETGAFEDWAQFLEKKAQYLAQMDETEEEAIYRLNKYCLVNWWVNPFDYLDDLLISPETKKYSEFNLAGGRFGRKTYEISNFIAKRLMVGFKTGQTTAIYGFRLYGADIEELKKEIIKQLENYGITESKSKKDFVEGLYIYTGKNNAPFFKFADGSFIYLKGIYKSTDRAITLKGLASAQGKDLAIIWQEEANEFSKAETQAIRMAVRDAKHRIYFSSSNPDELFQDYIAYCDNNVRFNEHDLNTNGQMFAKIFDNETERGKVFHFTNHKINPYMTKQEVIEMLELQKQDPAKYKIWGIGMPGGMESSIFSQYMTSKPINFQPTSFIAGIDLGFATSMEGHPTRVIFSGVRLEDTWGSRQRRVHPLDEYYHSNATMAQKNSETINRDIINFFIKQSKKYPQIMRGLVVRVDYGAGGLYVIERLNSMALTTYDEGVSLSSWLHFEPVDKKVWFTRDRIDITISMLSKNILTIDKRTTPWLYKEMSMIQWHKKKNISVNNEPKMIDLNDDGWDAFMYSVMPIIKELTTDFNESALYNKQYKRMSFMTDKKTADDMQW